MQVLLIRIKSIASVLSFLLYGTLIFLKEKFEKINLIQLMTSTSVKNKLQSVYMKKLDVLALANTIAIIDLVLHPLFHIWGWVWPRSYEVVMHEFVIGLDLHVNETFTPSFFSFWIIEAIAFWLLGFLVAFLYNKFAKN